MIRAGAFSHKLMLKLTYVDKMKGNISLIMLVSAKIPTSSGSLFNPHSPYLMSVGIVRNLIFDFQ